MSCLATYATLRVFSSSIDPDGVARILGIAPTSSRPIDAASRYRHTREWHLWRWSTRSLLQSRENIEHIRSITTLLDGKATALAELRASGCLIDIFCYWVSSGQGGPHLDVRALRDLAALELEVSWDVYFRDQAADLKPDSPLVSGGG